MKTCVLTIKPLSPFGTPLKGDTLFGQFCWQVAEDPSLIKGDLASWVSLYKEKPFAVFSSAFPLIQKEKPSFLCPRPPAGFSNPGANRKEWFNAQKENKKKKWMHLSLDSMKPEEGEKTFCTEQEAFEFFCNTQNPEYKKTLALLPSMDQTLFSEHERNHNTINCLTLTTGTGFFAPYNQTNTVFLPRLHLVIFLAFDENAMDLAQIKEAMIRIGTWGFGRDASTGLGRFELVDIEEKAWPELEEKHPLYSLGPCVPKKDELQKYFGNSFVRFGKHGSSLASSSNPYKKPIVMIDEGALLYPASSFERETPYFGTGLTGLSKTKEHQTIAQGYSLVLPIKGGENA